MRKFLSALLILSITSVGNAESFIGDNQYVGDDTLCYEFDTNTLTAKVMGKYQAGWKSVVFEGTSLTIPTSVTISGVEYQVTEVGNFERSINLETLIVPAPLKFAEDGGFKDSEKLNSVTLNEDITWLPTNCFYGTAVDDLSFIPAGVTNIPHGCFARTKITDLSTLPSTVESIGEVSSNFSNSGALGAFSECDNIVSLSVPSHIKFLGTSAFERCRNLSEVKLNEGLQVIGKNCFYNDSNINFVIISSTVTSIQSSAFKDCANLNQVIMGDNVNFIGGRAFHNCSGLTEFHFPDDLESVRSFVLTGTSINSLTIPAGVKRIMPLGLSSLRNCSAITFEDSDETLDFDYHASYDYGRDPWEGQAQDTYSVGEWLFNTNVTDLYLGRNTATWINPEYEFPAASRANEELTNPFYNLQELKSITIGKPVTDASQLVFENYSKLEQITMLTEIPPVLNPLSPAQVSTVKVIIPAGSAEEYKSVEGWSKVKFVEDTSSITNVMINTDNANFPVYNLQGIRVESSSLPAGIYIRSGKKFIVR